MLTLYIKKYSLRILLETGADHSVISQQRWPHTGQCLEAHFCKVLEANTVLSKVLTS